MMKILVGKNGNGEEMKWEEMSVDELATLASTTTLFDCMQSFVLTGALTGERQEEFLDLAEVFVESTHTFMFEEEKLLKAPMVRLQKAGAQIEVHKKAEKKERGFDPFGLTTALGAHDKKKLWLGLTHALRAGETPEALAGLLAWKVRNMLSGATTKYSGNELKQLSRQIVAIYHDSHRGAGELALLLERFALLLY